MSISADLARRVLEACKKRANELRSPVSIAIVDASGHLVLFERMMAPYGWATGNISLAKANTSVMFNQSTEAVAQWAASIPGFAASLSSMTDGKFIMAAGGWPIRINGVTVGGVGVSGGNAPGRDDEIARAGLSILAAYLQPAQAAPATPTPYYQPAQPAQPVGVAATPQPTPAPGYTNSNGEYANSAVSANGNSYSDRKESTDTSYLSNDEREAGVSYEDRPSSIVAQQDRSGDLS